jgi:Resolvase, N terminal domain
MPSTNGHGPKRAILYARVSTDEQARTGYSLAQQLEALREYAAREGYEVLEQVSDPGQSGASLALGCYLVGFWSTSTFMLVVEAVLLGGWFVWLAIRLVRLAWQRR